MRLRARGPLRPSSFPRRVPGTPFFISGALIMSLPVDFPSASAPPPQAGGPRGLIRWVGTNNPFYVLSALLICLGLWVSFGAQEQAEQTWALMGGLAGYT